MRTSFHHQSEAQHPKSSAIHKYAGRLPHLWVMSTHRVTPASCPFVPPKQKDMPNLIHVKSCDEQRAKITG